MWRLNFAQVPGVGSLLALAARLRRRHGARAVPRGGASAADIDRALTVVESSPWTYPNLLFRRDKELLFSDSGKAFVMYGRRHRTWVAMGDPVGPDAEAPELIAKFCALSERHGARPVFFEVRDENRRAYLERGLSLTMLGEEARVELDSFDIGSHRHAELRRARARMKNRRCTFEVMPAEAVPGIMPELRRISDMWLARKATQEKGFSNASFDPGYLARFPVAVVRSDAGILAFANLWQGSARQELSVDLMRHLPGAPNGTMDFLFTEILLWGKERGFVWFNFGVAPLSGLHGQAGSPLWRHFGTLLYRHGEHFYNFRGLRHYKEKFGPVWTPRYLAAPGGLALPLVLVDVAAIIAGSVRGIVTKPR